MSIELTADEARVLGCLLEKEVTTPEQYPLSVNALVSACNQKSNRDPLVELDETTVQRVIDALRARHLVSDRSGYGGRVPKYKQVFCNTEFGTLQFAPVERAIVCELLLRGPQSAGELRTRCARMAPVSGGEDVEAALRSLMEHPAGPFVARLPRSPGQRDLRYAHLLGAGMPVVVPTGGTGEESGRLASHSAGAPRGVPETRIADLEARLAALEDIVAALRDRSGGT